MENTTPTFLDHFDAQEFDNFTEFQETLRQVNSKYTSIITATSFFNGERTVYLIVFGETNYERDGKILDKLDDCITRLTQIDGNTSGM